MYNVLQKSSPRFDHNDYNNKYEYPINSTIGFRFKFRFSVLKYLTRILDTRYSVFNIKNINIEFRILLRQCYTIMLSCYFASMIDIITYGRPINYITIST